MPYVDAAAFEAARQIDLLSYLQAYEPGELFHVSGSTYCTREHDSLKISNGKGDALPGGREPADRHAAAGLHGPKSAGDAQRAPPAAAGCGQQL